MVPNLSLRTDVLEDSDAALLKLWHGANRTWSGFPEVQPCQKKSYEYGPGIYLTTHLTTARHYAKGGGSIFEMTLRDPAWLDIAQRLPLEEAVEFITTCPGLRSRKAILDDLRSAERRTHDGTVTFNNVVTLCVNHQALSGLSGPTLCRWLTAHGIDGTVESQQGGHENWVVIFNPSVIVAHRKMTPALIERPDWPTVLEQTAQERQRLEARALQHVTITDPSTPPPRPRPTVSFRA